MLGLAEVVRAQLGGFALRGLGPLFALVERAAEGRLALSEMVALFWHCRTQDTLRQEAFADAVVRGGLAAATPALRILLGQILQGR